MYISPKVDYLFKAGKYPEWEIKIDTNVEITLGNDIQINFNIKNSKFKNLRFFILTST